MKNRNLNKLTNRELIENFILAKWAKTFVLHCGDVIEQITKITRKNKRDKGKRIWLI